MHITEPWLPGSCIVTLARGMQRHGQPYTLPWHALRYTRLTHLVHKLWGMLHSMVAYTLWPSDTTCTPPPLASRFQQALALGSTTSLGSKTQSTSHTRLANMILGYGPKILTTSYGAIKLGGAPHFFPPLWKPRKQLDHSRCVVLALFRPLP